MKKNKLFVIFGGLISLIILIILFCFIELRAVSKHYDEVSFEVQMGRNKFEIVSDLKDAGIIRSKVATLAYVFFFANGNLQAGNYNFNRADSSIKIINQIAKGDTHVYRATVRLTLVEGKRVIDYAKLISSNLSFTEEDFLKRASDKEFLQSLINEYWFITDEVLNDKLYYPLEGYLAPDTYEIYEDATIDSVIYKLLNNTEKRLDKYRSLIEASNYSVHDLLAIASICETEATHTEDREKIAQVIYSRLDKKMNLGMDVTTYYGVFKDIGDGITVDDLNNDNPYNTRNSNLIGLPVGAICNVSEDSIKSALNPSDTDYLYFVADMTSGEIFFTKTYEEFISYRQRLG